MGALLLLTAALLACGDKDPDDSGAVTDGEAEAFADPSLAGPYAVGSAETELTGSWGTELPVQSWYPLTGEVPTEIHVYGGIAEGGAVDGGQADCSQPRPVVVFSHGNGGVRWQSFFLAEHLASHGYVVVAPDHVGNTLFDAGGGEPSPEIVFRRPLDVADSFDDLVARSEDPDDRLHGCVDPDAGYAVVGHSFGGFTSLVVAGVVVDTDQVAAFCAEQGGWLCGDVAGWAAENPEQTVWDHTDPRAWAAVPLSPAGYETLQGGLADVAVPTLVQVGDRDELTPWSSVVEPIYDGLTATPRAAAVLADAGHFTYSNVCELVPAYDDCSPPYLPPDEAHPIIATLTLAWLQEVRGFTEAQAYLPGEAEGVSWQESR